MRVQRALARAGIASRRQAEELIREGRVRVDGEVATLGSKVDLSRQKLTVGGKAVALKPLRWIAFHKPLGVVTTADDEAGRRTVFEFIPDPAGLTYVGRLDVMTTGLLLLTTDGEAVHRLTHPRYHIPRKYTALVHGRSTGEVEQAVGESVVLDGRAVVPQDVRVRPGKDGRTILDVTLEEGRNRVVRRWCEAMGLKVERLARLSYGPVRLGDLPLGTWRPLTPAEEAGLYAAIGESARGARRGSRVSRSTPGTRAPGRDKRAGTGEKREARSEERHAKGETRTVGTKTRTPRRTDRREGR